MFDIIDLSSDFQSNFCWIFMDSVLHTDYETEAEFLSFVEKLNENWLIKSRSNIDLEPRACLIQAIGDVLQNHINSEEMAERCHQELISKWIFNQKTPLN
ncbi:hypothetical protein [Runella zeae]|uniref:hypothetical protein n=1 Tax=Runella zeae TaxID=94255 RepID=UPI0023571F7A|nr:hypothetical protein [Runella zeae]